MTLEELQILMPEVKWKIERSIYPDEFRAEDKNGRAIGFMIGEKRKESLRQYNNTLSLKKMDGNILDWGTNDWISIEEFMRKIKLLAFE